LTAKIVRPHTRPPGRARIRYDPIAARRATAGAVLRRIIAMRELSEKAARS
jgi:hypothetical protein